MEEVVVDGELTNRMTDGGRVDPLRAVRFLVADCTQSLSQCCSVRF